MDEFELIEACFVRPGEAAGVVVGIGDDGAVLQPSPGCELINVIDTLVAGVHFPLDIDAADLGFRLVQVNLSDIAAMGASPRWMTLALTLAGQDDVWLRRFAAGLFEAADAHGLALAGGDLTAGPGLVASVQISGEVPAGAALRRDTASAGDTICVTGTLGDAAAGLEALQAGRQDAALAGRFLRPTARVEAGIALRGMATAAIDVSDGLYADLAKLLQASGVGGRLQLDKLPLSAALTAAHDADAQRSFALAGGDDYELCFTMRGEPPPAIAEVPVTAIGTVEPGSGLQCYDGSVVVPYRDSGYRHFQ